MSNSNFHKSKVIDEAEYDRIVSALENTKAKFLDLQKSFRDDRSPENIAKINEQFTALQPVLTNTINEANELTTALKLENLSFADQKKFAQAQALIAETMRKNDRAMKTPDTLGSGKTFGEEFKQLNAELEKTPALADQTITKVRTLQQHIKTLGVEGKSLFTELKEKAIKFIKWFAMTRLIMQARMYFRKLFTTVYELDENLIDLRKTFRGTNGELEDFYFEANKIAKQMGITTNEIIKQGAAWSRLGYSSTETMKKMSEMSAMFAAISPDMNKEQAQNGLVSIMKAFDIDPDNVLDEILSKVNIIGNTAATSNGEIVEMLQKSSAAMAAANNSLEQTISLGVAGVEVLRDASKVGVALKSVSMNIRALDEETGELIGDTEEVFSKIANYTKTDLNPTGVSIFTDKSHTTYRSTYDILKDISKVWKEISDTDQAALVKVLGGKYQGNVVAAIVQNFKAAEKAMDDMANSAGSAEAEMETIRDSAAFAMNELKTTFEELAQSAVTRDFLKGLIKTGTILLEIVTGIVKHVGAIPALLGTIFGIVDIKTRNLFSISNTSGKLTLFGSELGKGWFASLKANKAEITATRELANELRVSFDGITISEEMMTKVSASTSVQLKGLVNDFNAGKISAEEFRAGITNVQTSMQKMQSGMTTLKFGLKSFGATIASIAASTAVFWAISAILSLITKGIDAIVNRKKKIKETADEAKNAVKDLKNELDNFKKSTKDVGKQYAELAQGIKNLGKANQSRGKLSTSDYEDFLNLSNQLADLYPTLTKGYDENGNAILDLSGDVDTITESLQRLLEIQQRIANQQIVEKLPDIWKGYIQDLEDLTTQSDYADAVGQMYQRILDDLPIDERIFKVEDAYLHEKLIEAAKRSGLDDGKWFNNSLKKLYEEIYSYANNGKGGFEGAEWDLSSLTDEQIEQLKNELAKSAAEYQDSLDITKDKIEAANAGMSSYINAWLSNEWNFVKLDEPIQDALREILLSGDWIEDLPDEINKNNWDEVSSWLSQNLLYAVRNVNSKNTKQALTDAVAGTLSVDGFEKLIGDLKKVEGFDEKNPLIIYLQTKLDAKYDLINGVKERLKEEFRDRVVELSEEDLQIAANLEIPYDTLLSWDELNKKIQEYKKGKPIIKTFEETLEPV